MEKHRGRQSRKIQDQSVYSIFSAFVIGNHASWVRLDILSSITACNLIPFTRIGKNGKTSFRGRKHGLGGEKTCETRFVEIMDYVCKKDSLTDTIGYSGIKDFQFKCHSLVERHEEMLESWFFDHQDDGPSLEAFLCIEKLKFCSIWEAMLWKRTMPSGNGSRTGNGTCSCDAGFVGKMCSNCDSAYFAVLQNSTHIECDECFAGCSGGCVGASPKDCRACRIGYKMDPEIGCNDIDECVEAEKCPNAAEKCVNTPGSFECQCIDGFKRSDSGECVVDVVVNVDKTSDETNSSNSVELETNDEPKNTDEEKVQQTNDEL
uniref:protein disulfide-isomerase n=1 Tax=Globodera pallida TaxID=36090 RepID=A0A183CAP7_GLOPA